MPGRRVHVTVCTGFASPARHHLSSWLDFHIDVAGVDSFLLHDDTPHTDHAARKDVEQVLAPLRETGIAEMLPRSRWHWRDEVSIGRGIRARFVGQTDILTRCLTTAAARQANRASDEAWLIHIDIDEYLMPTVRRVVPIAVDAKRLPRRDSLPGRESIPRACTL